MADKVFIGMSGGVDSSVAAYILKKQGYDVTGVTMHLSDKYVKDFDSETVKSANSVAEKIGIGFEELDCISKFEEKVVAPFIATYKKGETPNPCVECNRCIKFSQLDFGNNKIATGHYAQIEFADGRWKLKKSKNLEKDQSYFLYTLSQDILSKVLFPIGQMNKEEVRKIAEEQGFINAHKKDSQDICFIPNGDYVRFIEKHSNIKKTEGDFVDLDGNVFGRHKGIINYTIGQRKGLGLSLKKPMYVVKFNNERNEVILGEDKDLFATTLKVKDFNWLSIENPNTTFEALGRIRYRHKESPCKVTPNTDGTVSIEFSEPQRAITPGQSFVLYDAETDSYVLGGGIIV